MKRDIVERTNTAEIRPEEQSRESGELSENLWNQIQLKGPQEQNKKEWTSSDGLCQRHKPQCPHRVEVSQRGPNSRQIYVNCILFSHNY